MDVGGQDCLPLGAQHNQSSSSNNRNDPQEDEHFHQVCKSYQQYATFHQTKQQGVNRRMCQMLNSSRNNDGTSSTIPCDSHPTIDSILPPSLHPQTTDNQQYQKQFCNATIRNQFFLDNVLKYSGVATSQDVLRQRRQQQQEEQCNTKSIVMEWTTEDQISKIDSVLKSVARDWSEEGKEERSIVYDRIIDALEKYLPLDRNLNNNNNGESSDDTPNHNCCNNDNCISNIMNDDESDIDDNNEEDQLSPPRVAVPGSGLGRLSWEIHSRGYSVEGSDFSLPMLLASDFMLNGCGHAGGDDEHHATGTDTYKKFGICPWICETKNVVSFDKQRIRTVIVPDVDPTRLQFNENNEEEEEEDDGEKEAPEFTMMAGEFLHLYSHFLPENQQTCNDHSSHQHSNSAKQKFHAIACSFFLDTAPSLPHYLLTIYHMLEEGGLLINFGPLMYHWSGQGALLPGDADTSTNINDNSSTYKKRTKHLDERYLSSIDYTWKEVRYMIVQCGFDIVEEDMYIPARYTSDERSMMKVVYDCVFLVARKKSMFK